VASGNNMFGDPCAGARLSGLEARRVSLIPLHMPLGHRLQLRLSRRILRGYSIYRRNDTTAKEQNI